MLEFFARCHRHRRPCQGTVFLTPCIYFLHLLPLFLTIFLVGLVFEMHGRLALS
jgi:hypothetical protein